MILKEELVKVGLVAKDAEDALRQVAQGFVDAGYGKATYPQAIVDREKVYPTGLPVEAYDIAIPHCSADNVSSTAVAIATLKEPVEMRMMGDPDTVLHPQAFFMLGIAEAHSQVGMLQRIIDCIQDADLLKRLYACETPHELYELMVDKIGD